MYFWAALMSLLGYRFREARSNQQSQSAEATANLKSPEELEQEDRDAQSAVGEISLHR